ncbi:FAD binding domain-containing protein [Mycolicibacterium stellerae]|uniref:FAD binding domain-containing protein n=1 Tax=Mycolicibacterium stellerae TaxID=2358193 RepID=UPI000F0B091C|nr:FAD-dependent monooxygenase [Mycolicibacterium stellerae]
MRTLVIGGSLGGLAAAHEMRFAGADVTVYERSVDRTQPRGAGIVMQPEVADLLGRLGRSVSSVSVALSERQHLHRRGEPERYSAPQWMTAWDTLYHALREPIACMRMDSTLTGLSRDAGGVTATFGDGPAAVGDFVVGADGIGSATRRLLTGRDELRYPGYVAFRGLEPEADVPEHLVGLLAERFTMFAVPGLQMLCYLVPGAAGERAAGQRRVNWVWYVNTAQARLDQLLTGRGGQRFDQFLPPGELTDRSQSALLELAECELPRPFVELLEASRVFLQPVFDLPPTRMVTDHVALIGDAAGTVRPHTASGTSKAFGDAAGLAAALADWRPGRALPLAALHSWQRARLAALRAIADAGVRLASRSGLGATGPQYLRPDAATGPLPVPDDPTRAVRDAC